MSLDVKKWSRGGSVAAPLARTSKLIVQSQPTTSTRSPLSGHRNYHS
jgi:hypothetical protein